MDDPRDDAAGGPVLTEVAGGLAVITLNRPATGNALDAELVGGLLGALVAVRDDDGVRAVVLTGAGDSFCVGRDPRERAGPAAGGPPSPGATAAARLTPLTLLLAELPKPVVAAMTGVAAGAGLGLALACDLRVAAAGATLSTGFTALGASPDAGMSWTLPRLVGSARATALLLLAEPCTTEHALEMGLVNAVVGAEDVRAVALGLGQRLAEGPTAAYSAVKAALLHAGAHDLASSLAEEDRLRALVEATADHAEGVRAAVAGETPSFTGS